MRVNIKFFLVLIWGIILGIHTWTDSLYDLLRFQQIDFKWNPSPDFLSFFNLTDITKIHHFFIMVKTGHFLGFGLFDFLLFYWLRNHKKALIISFCFALLTEVLQLFFYRDGRLYDLVIDFCGALAVSMLIKRYQKR